MAWPRKRLPRRQGRAREIDRAEQVHFDDATEDRCLRRCEGATVRNSRVVDEHVDAAKALNRGLDGGLARTGVGDVAGKSDRMEPGLHQLTRDRLDRAGVAIQRDDACAAASETKRKRTAKPAACAAHHYGCAIERATHQASSPPSPCVRQ